MWIISLLCLLASTNSEIVNIKIKKGLKTTATIQGTRSLNFTLLLLQNSSFIVLVSSKIRPILMRVYIKHRDPINLFFELLKF